MGYHWRCFREKATNAGLQRDFSHLIRYQVMDNQGAWFCSENVTEKCARRRECISPGTCANVAILLVYVRSDAVESPAL